MLRSLLCAVLPLAFVLPLASALVVPALAGISRPLVSNGQPLDVSDALSSPGLNLVIFGTYPGAALRHQHLPTRSNLQPCSSL